MTSPIDIAWSVLKALPEDSLYTEEDMTKPGINVPGGYGRMPFMERRQTRYKTMHPAIVGMLNRLNEPVRHAMRNPGEMVDVPKDFAGENVKNPQGFKYPGQPYQILDVPTVTGKDFFKRPDDPTSMYQMMGRPDVPQGGAGEPDFATFLSDGGGALTRTENNPFRGYPEHTL